MLFHALVAQRMHLPGKEAHQDTDSRKDQENHNGQPPFQVKQKNDAAQEMEKIIGHLDNGTGKKPSQPLHVGGEAGHKIASLLVVKKGLGESKGPLQQSLLDVEKNFLLVATEKEFLQEIAQSRKEGNSQKKKNHPGQKLEMLFQDYVVD
jgi:hypothetical protein